MTQLSNQPQASNNPVLIEELLTTRGATWAVVGLTDSPHRVAKPVASFVKNELGMRIVPVNPVARPLMETGLPTYYLKFHTIMYHTSLSMPRLLKQSSMTQSV